MAFSMIVVTINPFSSIVQFSHSVVFESLRPHGLQHTKLPSPSPTPRACSNSCPSSWWCHPTIASSVIPFSSCLQSFSASGSFPMNPFFASDGQSIGTSTSVLPMNIQDWFPLGLTGLISLQSKGLSKVFFNTTVQKHQFFGSQVSIWSNSYNHTWPLDKGHKDKENVCSLLQTQSLAQRLAGLWCLTNALLNEWPKRRIMTVPLSQTEQLTKLPGSSHVNLLHQYLCPILFSLPPPPYQYWREKRSWKTSVTFQSNTVYPE